jgi:hypothetical protein
LVKHWWVNQTTQWKKDYGENIVTAYIPEDRKPHYTHRLVHDMRKWDVMLGFRRQIGVVCWGYITSEKPKTEKQKWPPDYKEVDAWTVDVEYHHLTTPISLEKFVKDKYVQSLKQIKYAPINCKDDVIRGYAFRFTKDAFDAVRKSQADEKWVGSP